MKIKISLIKYIKLYTDLTFIFLSFAFILLIHSFITTDYSLNIVLNHSHETKPLIYKISGIWSNHEGSMILWIWLFSLFNMLFLYFSKFDKLDTAKILSIQSAILFSFLLFIILNSNPFTPSLEYFPTGKGLNPLLQDLGLLIHPPTLYLGFVNFSLGFSAAIIALLNGSADNNWFNYLKPWIKIPWTCLTAGIGLGSWWAYRELGWGGFWFWDPVENASLLPWLSATALIHSVNLSSTRGNLKSWSIFLSILTFILTVFGTFLVRSGVVNSVHSFTHDTTKGVFIFIILSLATIIGIALFYWRISKIPNKPTTNLFSKDGGIIANNIILIFIGLAILAGILYPILYEFLYHKSIVVNDTYYKTMLKISLLPLLIFIGSLAFLKWGNDNIRKHLFPWSLVAITSILLTFITNSYKPIDSQLSLVILTLSYFLIANLLLHFIKNLVSSTSNSYNIIPMFLSHMGVAIMIIAIIFNYNWQKEKSFIMKAHTQLEFANHSITLENINYYKKDNFYSREAKLAISSNDRHISDLYPATRFYPIEDIYTNESAIYHSFIYDFYFTIGEVLPGDKIMINIQYKPFVSFIWLSIALICSGGITSILRKKRKS